ncbi:MAG: two-component system response regulator [Desulfobaccales bacterium]
MANYEILLLGDGSHSFRTMGWVLEYKGFAIKAFRGPESALEALVKKNYDLIIAKLSREEKDNLAVLRQAKKINPLTKVMLITDRLDLAFPLEAYNTDIDDYLIMPISSGEFCRRVENCLEGLVVDLVPAHSFTQTAAKVKEWPYNRLVHEPTVFVAQQ